MKKRKKDLKKLDKTDMILIFLIFLIFFLVMVMGVLYLKSDKDCVENPIKYGINKMQKDNNANITCICMAHKPNTEYIIIDGD